MYKRQAQLASWLAINELTRTSIASELGLSSAYVGQLLNGKRLTPKRIEQLKGLGIPEELLPPLRARARGNPSESGE